MKICNLNMSFDSSDNFKKLALKDVSIDFLPGIVNCIIGHNGSGKSTLLKVLNGIYSQDSGSISLSGQDISKWSESKRAKIITYYEQNTRKNLIPNMSIYENIILNSNIRQSKWYNFYSNHQKKDKIKKILLTFGVGLEKRINDQVAFLSGGEQQVVIASKILYSSPQILFLDEFTSALDAKLSPLILQAIYDYTKSSNAITIIVSHDLDAVAKYADSVIVLKNGTIKNILHKNDLLDSQLLRQEINEHY